MTHGWVLQGVCAHGAAVGCGGAFVAHVLLPCCSLLLPLLLALPLATATPYVPPTCHPCTHRYLS